MTIIALLCYSTNIIVRKYLLNRCIKLKFVPNSYLIYKQIYYLIIKPEENLLIIIIK